MTDELTDNTSVVGQHSGLGATRIAETVVRRMTACMAVLIGVLSDGHQRGWDDGYGLAKSMSSVVSGWQAPQSLTVSFAERRILCVYAIMSGHRCIVREAVH